MAPGKIATLLTGASAAPKLAVARRPKLSGFFQATAHDLHHRYTILAATPAE